MLKEKIAFLGAGNMAEALIRGVIDAKLLQPTNIIATDIREDRLRYIADKTKVSVNPDNVRAVKEARVIVLAVKPQDMDILLGQIRLALDPSKLIISIAAGITTRYIEDLLVGEVPVVRVMPNTAVRVMEGASAFSLGRYAEKDEESIAEALLGAVGRVVKVPEDLMDVITALSGSGPAYIFFIIGSLMEAAISLGLDRDTACILAAQTTLGAAKLVLATGEDPLLLREKVASPGGTTEAALRVFDQKGLSGILSRALNAAAARSKELAR